MKKLILLLTAFSSLYLHAQWRSIYQDADSSNPVVAASFFTPASGFVATYDWIGFSSDSGHTFQQRNPSFSNVNFNNYPVNLTFGFTASDIQAFGSNTLVVSGNYAWQPSVLYSSNGGMNWQLVYWAPLTSAASNSEYKMSFPGGGSTGYAVQSNEIIKTTNGGASWTSVYSAGGGFFTVSATSANTVYAAGPNVLLKTTNGGTSWSAVTGPFVIQSMTAYSDLHVYVITTQGDCYSSMDGGNTWQVSNTPTGQLRNTTVNSLHFVSDTMGYAFGNGIYETRNSGKSWEQMPVSGPTGYPLFQQPFFYNSQQAWIGCYGGTLLLTGNGGGVPPPRALFDVNTSQVCASNTVQLLDQSQSGYTYAWYRNNVLFANTYNASYTTTTGSDVIELIVSNGQQSDTAVQTVNAATASSIALTVSPRQDTICGDGTMWFDVTNSQTNVQYWAGRTCCSFSVRYQGNGGTLSIPVDLAPNEDSTSIFTVFAATSNACGTDTVKKTFPIRIILANPPTSTITDTICKQGTFYIRVSNSRQGYWYWADPGRPVAGTGDTIALPCAINQASGSVNIDNNGYLQNYTFPIYISSEGAGCGPRIVAYASMISRYPGPNFDLHGYTWFTGDTIGLIQESTYATSYLWKGGDGASFATSNLTAPTIAYSTMGYKHIGLLAFSKEGCVDSMERVITIEGNTPVAATAICGSGGRGNVVDSIQSSSYYVDRGIYEDEYGNRILAGAFTSWGWPVGQEGWWAQKRAKDGTIIWSLSQPEFDYYYTYYFFPHIIIEQAVGDSLGNTYLMGHEINQQYVTATGEPQTPVQRMADFLIKVSEAGHIVWVKTFNSELFGLTYPFCSGGSLLRGKGNTLYVIAQRYPGYDYQINGTTVLPASTGHEGVIMEFDIDGNLLRTNSFQCPASSIYNPYIGTTDNYWHTPPATWVNGKLIIYTTLYPAQTSLENAAISFNSTQITSALAVFDTASLHATRVLPVYNTLTGAAAGVTAETYAMDSAGGYYASFNGLVPTPAPAYPDDQFYDSLKGVTYIESFDSTGNLRWVKVADGLEPKRMIATPGGLKVCGTNYAYSGWTTGWQTGIGMQGPVDSTVKKVTSVGSIGGFTGSGGHGLGSLDIVVATLQSSDGQLLDYLPLGSQAEDEFSTMAKGAGDQLWVAGSVNAHWRSFVPTIAGYALYTYKLPITNDCEGGYPNVPPFVRWNPSPDTVTCIDSLYTVSWTCNGTGTLSIRYSTDGGAHYNPLATGLPGTSYSYTFNPAAVGTLGKAQYIIADDSGGLADTTTNQLSITVPTAVTLTVDDSAICAGQMVHFMATPANGGSDPLYHWLVGQTATGGNADTLNLNTLGNMDVVKVSMSGSLACSVPAAAVSNTITMRVTTGAAPALQISGASTGVAGHTDTLYAHAANVGTQPVFSWQDSTARHNWEPITGAADSVLYYIPADSGDEVRSIVRGSVPCSPVDTAASNVIVCSIFSIVTPPPPPPSDTTGSGDLHLFPNPVYNSFTIDTLSLADGWQMMDILDINGRVLIDRSIVNMTTVTIPVDALSKGIYYVRLIGSKRTAYIRFLKF
jgi:hypothetical protein